MGCRIVDLDELSILTDGKWLVYQLASTDATLKGGPKCGAKGNILCIVWFSAPIDGLVGRHSCHAAVDCYYCRIHKSCKEERENT